MQQTKRIIQDMQVVTYKSGYATDDTYNSGYARDNI